LQEIHLSLRQQPGRRCLKFVAREQSISMVADPTLIGSATKKSVPCCYPKDAVALVWRGLGRLGWARDCSAHRRDSVLTRVHPAQIWVKINSLSSLLRTW
jgi:hypothetical protein